MTETETNEITETTSPDVAVSKEASETSDISQPSVEVQKEVSLSESVSNSKSGSSRVPEINRIMKLQVPIIVRLAEKVLPVGEITQLIPGAIIEFNKTVGEDLDLMINNKVIGSGQAVKVGEKFGLKITRLNSLQEMIKAMGK
jgi:flagellar motor switch protein FliN/FliY